MSKELLNSNNQKTKSEFDIGRLVGEVIDHRKLIVIITSVITLGAIIYVLFSTPIYQANALVQVEERQGNAILDSLSQSLPGAQPKSDPEITLLQSRMIIGKTVDDLNLQTQIEKKHLPFIGKGLDRITGNDTDGITVSSLSVLPEDDGSRVAELQVTGANSYLIKYGDMEKPGVTGELINIDDMSMKVDSINAKIGTEFKITYLTKLQAINKVASSLTVFDKGRDTGMLNINVVGEKKADIKNILNSITQNYLTQNISRQAAQDAKSLDFLSEQLPKVRHDLDSSEDKLNAYRQKSDSVDLSLEAKSVLDQVVNVDNQLNELVFREAEISQLFTKEHPTYRALVEKREILNKEKAKLNKRVSAMPVTQQEVLRLSRDVESGRIVYMQLLNRQQELSIAKSSAIGNVRIIDSAVVEPKAIKPQSILIVGIGFIAGIIISFWVILFKVFLRKGVESPTQLEELGINVYSSIPVSEWLNKSSQQNSIKKNPKKAKFDFLALDNPADLSIEAIRSLRTSLHFAMMSANNNVLMISGASPGVGKTFVSSNLAAVMAQSNKKVLFIDTDMRKGYAHKIFNLSNSSGLSDYLSGQVSKESIISKVDNAGFDFIARGVVPPNPAELLMHNRLDELMTWASGIYDLVIIDTPPILAVTDAGIIGRCAGTTLMVVRHELNTIPEVIAAMRRFEMNNVEIKGVILNGIIKRAINYYAYGYTNYSYDYSSKD